MTGMFFQSHAEHVAQLVQELGLVRHYRDDAAARHFCGMLDGLAFLPLAEVADGMAHLRNVAPVKLIDLVDYFDATYVTGRYRVVQRALCSCLLHMLVG